MNGPLKMYSMKPVLRHDLAVELPSCMYKLKNIHAVRNGTVITDTGHVSTTKENLDTFDQVIQFLKKNQAMPDMAALIVRQEQILQQLADLKKQMLSLKENLKVNTSSQKTTSATNTPPVNFDSTDIVINASPSYPPYTLKILQKLWKASIHLHIQSHLHSTVSSLPTETQAFVDELLSFLPSSEKLPQLTIRIIWKEVGPYTELVVSRVPILGEVNILRYLARTTSRLDYESRNPFELDPVLDTCYNLVQSKTKTDRSSAMHVLNKKLGKSQWFCGRTNFTIVDIAAYSALKQIPQIEINVNLTKWLQRCETALC